MAQHLKDDVHDRIASAALSEFARNGFARSKVAAIASAAGVSTGNVYRYYPGKEQLFDAVVPAAFARRLTGLLRRRIRSLDGVADLRTPGPGSEFAAASEALLALSISDRLRIVVLLARAGGTRHERFAANLVKELQRRALAHARSHRPDLKVSAPLRFSLEQIYRHWLSTLVGILERFDAEADIRAAVACFSSYHMAGLRSLLT
jgi:AcrR family transcriptional regulator